MNDRSGRPALKLNLGCGRTKLDGFLGVDASDRVGADIVADLLAPWVWAASSVSEIYCANLLHLLEMPGRIHLMNEMHRVLMPGGFAVLKVPHWASMRAYSNPECKWPPVSEAWFDWLVKAFRDDRAPDVETITCDFPSWTISYDATHESVAGMDEKSKLLAHRFYRDAFSMMTITLTKPRL